MLLKCPKLSGLYLFAMHYSVFGIFFGEASQHFLSRNLFLLHYHLHNKAESWVLDHFRNSWVLLALLLQASADHEEMSEVPFFGVCLVLSALLFFFGFDLQPVEKI